MTDDRYKQIMADLGQPNSRSLLQALQKVANEVAQEQETVRRLIAEAVPNAVAAELERVANEPPVNGNDLAMARVLMAAAAIRNRSKA